MNLLTAELRAKLPGIYDTEKSEEQMCVCKFFLPEGCWTWYVIEFDPEEELFFGLVDGLEAELGYFSLEELESIRGPRFGLPVERDLYFEPTPLKTILAQVRREAA